MPGQERWNNIVQSIKRILRMGRAQKYGTKTTHTGGRGGEMSGEICDPNGIGQHEPGAKLDSGKPDASLLGLFGLALLEVAKVGTIGAAKYTRGGWREVPDGFNRYTAAMLRHYLAEDREEIDDDTEMYHCAQVAWNALARLEYFMERKYNYEKDDSIILVNSIHDYDCSICGAPGCTAGRCREDSAAKESGPKS